MRWIESTRAHFKAWPKWHKTVLLVVLAGFWFSGALFAYRHGNRPHFHTDSSTEGMTIFAANHYLDHGFFKNFLLPTYPPFGHDPDGKQRTEPFVYNHYLAGPDLVLAGFMKVFGRDALWAGRLIPHTLTVLAILLLVLEFSAFMKSSLAGVLLLGLLMVPKSLTAWSICLYGHSYVMAFYLFMVAGLLALANAKPKSPWPARALGFFVGLLQMFFDLDWVPLTFISCASLVCLLLTRLPRAQGMRVLVWMVIGGTTGAVYQVFISSLYFGSPLWVIENLLQWARFRVGAEHVEGITQGDLRLHKVLKEYNRQTYGATGFTAYNLMALSAVFLVMGYFGKVLSKLEFKRGLGAVVLAYLAAAFWNVVMRQHSVAHIHFIPRHYFVVYMTFVLIALPVAYQLVVRARRAG
ncbi:MAG: hypothetical protein AB1540_06205 [Bdellovibrionota bacterium]